MKNVWVLFRECQHESFLFMYIVEPSFQLWNWKCNRRWNSLPRGPSFLKHSTIFSKTWLCTGKAHARMASSSPGPSRPRKMARCGGRKKRSLPSTSTIWEVNMAPSHSRTYLEEQEAQWMKIKSSLHDCFMIHNYVSFLWFNYEHFVYLQH